MKRKILPTFLIAIMLLLSSVVQLAPTPTSAEEEELTYPKPTYIPEIMHGPYIDRITWLIMTETMTIWEAFKAGELSVSEVVPGVIPEEDMLDFAEKNPDKILLYRNAPESYGCYLGFNVQKWPTSQVEVRRAVAHLIDWDYHATTTWKPGVVPDCWGYAPGAFGYATWHNPEVNYQARYPFSTELAKKELTDNGWKYEDGKWIKYFPNGTKREMGTLKYVCPGYSPERIEIGIKLAEDAAKIGMKWEVVHPPDWPSTERAAYIERDFNLFVNCATADTLNPPIWYWSAYNSKSWKPKGTTTINHFGIKDPVMDELTDKLMVTNSIEEAIKLVWQIQKRDLEMCYVMPAPWGFPPLLAIWVDEFEYPFGLAKLPNMSVEDWKGEHQSFFGHLNIRPKDKPFGGTYVENRAYWPTSWNPLNWMEAPEMQIFEYMYLRLAHHIRLPDGRDVVVPMLARNWTVDTWEVAPGKVGFKITFYLFDNITWHDGVPFTAEDVKYTLDLIKAVKTPCAIYARIWPMYVKSEVIDPYTIEIYTNRPGIFQLYTIIDLVPLPKHIYELQPDPIAFDNFPPIGNGPFVFEDMKSHEYISLRANPRYYLSARRLITNVKLAETEKVVGEPAKFQFELTGPTGEKVTNATVTLSVWKAGEEVLSATATHIGGGVYEATIDTGTMGAGDYVVHVHAKYLTPLFTYETPTTIYLTVLPKVYKTLIESVESVKEDLSATKEAISGLQTTISQLQDAVSGVAGISGTVTASMGLSVVSIIIAIVAVALAVRKK